MSSGDAASAARIAAVARVIYSSKGRCGYCSWSCSLSLGDSAAATDVAALARDAVATADEAIARNRMILRLQQG